MSRPYVPEDISPEQTEQATSLRVPFINTSHPRWFYVTAIVVDTSRYGCGGQVPTEDEVAIVASFNDQYREYWYRDSYKATMRDFAPFDIDGGAVGRYLIKHDNGGWGYRNHTWTSGPLFVPQRNDDPIGLVACLDKYHDLVPDRWDKWKAEHSELFASPSPSLRGGKTE